MADKSKRRNWSREEHILAFDLYCKIPFGKIHMHNPQVIELVGLNGRSVGSVSYKLANFARLDPSLKQHGVHGLQQMVRLTKFDATFLRGFAQLDDCLVQELRVGGIGDVFLLYRRVDVHLR